MASASPAAPASKSEPQTIDLHTVPTPQLSSLKSQLSSDVQTLTASYTSLRSAQAKFGDCISSITNGVEKGGAGKYGKEGREVLVPLTGSLYVPGRLADAERVVVDVGTGFYVEKGTKEAKKFYEGKVKELGKNLMELEGIVQGKQGTLRVVEDVLRQKVIQEQTAGAGSSAAAKSGAD